MATIQFCAMPIPDRDNVHAARVRMKVATAVALVLGTISSGEVFAQAAGQSSGQLDDLRRQVQELQRQLDRLKAQQDATARQGSASPAPDGGRSARASTGGPGIQAGPLTLTFGGFAELAAIYRNRNETADVSSNFNTSIPFPNLPQYHMSEFRGSARQSRISLLTEGPDDGRARAEAYVEMDFQSSAPTANSVESNSYNPRMRHFYGTYYNKASDFYLLAGQTYSLVTLEKKGMMPRQEQIPLVIDGQYVPGFNWTRNPQLRFVKDFGGKLALGLSLESPQAIIFKGPNNTLVPSVSSEPGGSLFAPTVNYSTDVAPDVVAKVAWDPGYGHYEFYGLGRAFRARAGSDNKTTYGGGVGLGMILPLGSQVDFQLSGLAGRGIGRYGSAQLPDVTVKPDGELSRVSAYQALVGLIYRPASDWTVYAYAGIEDADAEDFTAVVNGNTLGFGYGSPLYDNSGCLIEGSSACAANTSRIEHGALGMWWKYYQGALGNMQVGLQGSYTRRNIFEGIGGDPDTNITMGMLSFRYYPYQK
ncbi:hypothetical protein [Povalibacter sp.]|uniref:hypothetical protein n=1 Tax=Povalibacter sp. TaxID=1962978 RepID=UPI002F417448